MILDWRRATKHDRRPLQGFECTASPPRQPGGRPQPHPKPWEHAVQSAVRTLDVPLRDAADTFLLGYDGDGRLGAVALWSSMSADLPLHKIRLLAVSLTHRGTSAAPGLAGAVASETLDVVLTTLSAHAAGERVFGLVDHRNSASLRLLRTHGFVHLPDGPVNDPDLQMWGARLPHSPTR